MATKSTAKKAPAKAKKPSAPKPEGPRFLRLSHHAEVVVAGGAKRGEAGDIVVIGDETHIYPVERFVEAYPDVAIDNIPEG